MSDAINVIQDTHRSLKTTPLISRQINLRDVTGDNCLRIRADTSEKHFYLQVGGILGFIKNDKSIIKSAAAHVCEGSNFDSSCAHVVAELIGGDHVIEGIIQGTQVRINLFF